MIYSDREKDADKHNVDKEERILILTNLTRMIFDALVTEGRVPLPIDQSQGQESGQNRHDLNQIIINDFRFNIITAFITITPERYIFLGFTRYYTIF